MPAQVAAWAIHTYTHAGGRVLDPDCAAATCLLAAITAGRHALGVTTGRRGPRTTRQRLLAAQHTGASGDALLCARLDLTVARHLSQIDLLLTAVRTPPHHQQDRHARDRALAELHRLLHTSHRALRPGGHAVLTLRRHPRRRTHLPTVINVATSTGLVHLGQREHPEPAPPEPGQHTATGAAGGAARQHSTHDVLIFTRPGPRWA